MRKLGLSLSQLLMGLFALALIGGPLVMAAPLSPSMMVDGSFVSWASSAGYERAVLRIGGPNGDLTRTFTPDQTPSFDLAELNNPVDGLYTFELTWFLPQGGSETVAQAITETVFLRASAGRFLSSKPEEPTSALQSGDPAHGGEPLRNLSAEQVINQDLTVNGSVCVGEDCVANEDYSGDILRLKGDIVRIEFDDTSTSSFPDNDWQLTANDSASGGADKFSIDDATGDLTPFTILAGAPDNSLFIDADGDVGLGTSVPSTSLHIRRTDETARLTVEEASAVANGRILYELINNGAVRFSMVDTSVNQTWRFTNGATRFRIIDTSDLNTVEFDLSPDGDLTLSGEIFTSGACSVGCDRVFADDYDLESIEEHAERMWANSHLPGVGPTAESGQVNLSQKTLGILNELEKAHIYIEQLHKTLEDVRSVMDRQTSELTQQTAELAQQAAELEALKQVVHGLAGARSRP